MSSPVHLFETCRIDTAARELWRGDELLVLPPKVFDVITYLLEHRERAIGRDELIAAVWGSTEVTDTLLSQTILRARRAVGDSAEEQRAIRTVPRFGYRWVGEVGAADPLPSAPRDSVVANTASDVAVPRPARRVMPALIATSAAAVLAVIIAASWWIAASRQPLNPSTARPTIAPPVAHPIASATLVLPVQSDEAGGESWIALGVMDLIARRLREGGEPVVPSETVLALLQGKAPAQVDHAQLAQISGARLLVQPRAEREGPLWKVTLNAHGNDSVAMRVEASAAHVLDAAVLASDRLLRELHQRVPQPTQSTPTQDAALAELLVRSDAEMLANRLDAAREMLQTAAAELRASPSLRYQLAQLEYRAGHLDAAQAALETLLSEVSAEAQPILRAQVFIAFAAVAVQRGQYSIAEKMDTQAIELLEPRNDPIALGKAYSGRGRAKAAQHRFGEALADHARARVLLEGAGDFIGVARVDASIGLLDAERNRLADAVPSLEQAIRRFELVHDNTEEIGLRMALAFVRMDLLDHAGALADAERIWSLAGDNPDLRLHKELALTRADTLVGVGRLHEAGQILDGLLQEANLQDGANLQARAQLLSADIALQTQQPERAGQLASAALGSFNLPAGYEPSIARAWLFRTRALRMQGDDAAARAFAPQVVAWSQREGDEQARMYALLIDAEQLAAARDHIAARSRYEEALQKSDALALPGATVDVVESFGNFLIEEADLGQAAAVIGRVANWADRDFPSALLQARLNHALGRKDASNAALLRAQQLAGERKIRLAASDSLAAKPAADGRP